MQPLYWTVFVNNEVHCCWICVQVPSASQWLCLATQCSSGPPQDLKGDVLLVPTEEKCRTIGRGRHGSHEKFYFALKALC